jgi:hypothetical protein
MILFKDERSDKPDRLRNEATSCNGLRFTSDSGYLEIEYDEAAAIGFSPSQGPREKGCHEHVLLCSCLSLSIRRAIWSVHGSPRRRDFSLGAAGSSGSGRE